MSKVYTKKKIVKLKIQYCRRNRKVYLKKYSNYINLTQVGISVKQLPLKLSLSVFHFCEHIGCCIA